MAIKKTIKRRASFKKKADHLTLKLKVSLKGLRGLDVMSEVDELERFFERFDLTTAKNGKGGVAYDNWSYDRKSKELEFFWFLENTPAGKAQYGRLGRKLGLVKPLIEAHYKR